MTNHEPPGPPFVAPSGRQAALYLEKDLKEWLECYPHAADSAMAEYRAATSHASHAGTPIKTFSDLLVELEAWLGTHRPDFLNGFNGPASQDQLDQFERDTGLVLPGDYKLLMSWRDGHSDEHWEILDPFENQGLLSMGNAESTIQCMNKLLQAGEFDENNWRRDWLPFMGDMFGNHLCVDLSPTRYGRVFSWDHEGGQWDVSKDLVTWLTELVGMLQYLNVQVWEREFEC